ncbi:MAG: class I SAM-dependent methyltransferase [Planctomycetota bacterium]|jgi:SAM-dependent methyltransferase
MTYSNKIVKSDTKKVSNVTRGYGVLEGFLAKKRARMADKLIPEDLRTGRILDIGCGKIPFFLINTKFEEKYGMDPVVDTSYCEENMKLERFDIVKNGVLDFESDFFDVVVMLAVFEHVEPDKLAGHLEEVKRVLKPSGRLILTTPTPWVDKLLKVMARLRLVSPEEINEHKGSYNHASIASYLDKAGFEKEKMRFGYFEMYLNNWAYVYK